MKSVYVFVLIAITAFSIACGTVEERDGVEVPEIVETETAEPEATEPAVVRVDPDGKGDFATLEAAVAGVAPNTTIALEAGRFELTHHLLITKSLSIRGAGVDNTIISYSGSPVVLAFDGEQLTVEDLSLESTGEFAADVVVILAGEIELRNCSISGGASAQDESIDGHGLWLFDGVSAIISNCSLKNNTGIGLLVSDGRIGVERGEISNNRAGIVMYENSSGEIANSTISGNEGYGVMILDSASADVLYNTITDNGATGIYIKSGGVDNSQVRGNTLSRNEGGGNGTDIVIWESHSPTLTGNSCDKNGRSLAGMGWDMSGIAFIARSSLPSNPSVEGNSCSVAMCSTPSGTLIQMECE